MTYNIRRPPLYNNAVLFWVSGTAVDPPCTITPTWVTHGNDVNARTVSTCKSLQSFLSTASFFLSRYSSYVRFDILQRILSRLFGITVIHAMVITDIDDKIIRRGWEVRTTRPKAVILRIL